MRGKSALFGALTAVSLALAAYGLYAHHRGSEGFTHEPTGLSIGLPDGFSARLAGEAPAEIIVVESAADPSRGYQIAVSPWDEPASALTADRVRQDLPELDLSGASTVALPFGSTGLSFEAGAAGDRTREMWFVREGHLYQMSAPAESAGLLEEALREMSFGR